MSSDNEARDVVPGFIVVAAGSLGAAPWSYGVSLANEHSVPLQARA